jgi:uncharacterized BrkB/YihY/UPF0761 family membrane protein
MPALKDVKAKVDSWQQRNRVAAPTYGVVKKFGDDEANFLVVALGWYGFTAIYPLLLVVVTILGFVGVASLGSDFVKTLHQFPVIGQQFNPAKGSSQLHGSVFGLIVGLVVLLYGAQGVTQVAQTAMAKVWNVPRFQRRRFVSSLGHSIGALAIIGGTFLVNAALAGLVTRSSASYAFRVPMLILLVVINVGLYFAAFRVLTPKEIPTRPLLPGAILAGVGFTLLITVGTGLVQHQLRGTSSTYGAFASVIGVVVFLLLLAKLTLYAAELNPVLERKLYPRAMSDDETTGADRQVYQDLVHAQRPTADMKVGVEFQSDSTSQDDVEREATERRSPSSAREA